MHYKTFDGKIMKFVGGKCEYIMMSDCKSNKAAHCNLSNSKFMVKVRNTRCINSFEAHTCKSVHVTMKMLDGSDASIIMLQKNVTVQVGTKKLFFSKGTYLQPKKHAIEGLEIFKVKP